MKKIISMLIMGLTFLSCSSEEQKTELKKITPLLKRFISIENLEAAGFESFKSLDYNILIIDENFYVLNSKNSTIAKFKQTKPLRVYKNFSQGPGGMLTARSLFLYDRETIAVFDVQKLCVLFFDFDLNYKNEIRINPAFSRMRNTGKMFTASGNFPDNKLFSILDRHFNTLETFVTHDLSIPFKVRFPPQFFNRCYLVSDRQVAYTYWLYLTKQCKVDIFDIDTRVKITSLKWNQSNTPSQSDVEKNLDSYTSVCVAKGFKYYIVNSKFQKKMWDIGYNDILIFQLDGQLIFREQVPFSLIESVSSPSDTRLFFFDDEKGILVLDLKEI